MNEPVPGPSGPGSVILDLGPGTGALVLHTPPELDGREIEISLAGTAPAHRTHSRVRPRQAARHTQYAAVYPQVEVGIYTVWDDEDTPALTVAIHGGRVTTAWWPGCSRQP
jgi:hypothetical protein